LLPDLRWRIPFSNCLLPFLFAVLCVNAHVLALTTQKHIASTTNMAQTTVPDSTSNGIETVHPAIILGNPRDDDPTTRRLREDPSIELDDIVSNLHQYQHISTSAASSTIPTSSVFSSRKESVGTKPTSAGTSYLLHKGNGKGKATVTYSSSLSATHGSTSESEHERARDDPFAGMGDWAGVKQPRTTKKKPSQPRRKIPGGQLGSKKPVVIIQGDRKAGDDGRYPFTETVSRRSGNAAKYLRLRSNKPTADRLDLAEEGRVSPATTSLTTRVRLSRVRQIILVSVVVLIVLIFTLSTWGAHHTGKSHMSSTKGIVFSATVMISLLTVCAMIVARRTVQEALLTGLLELIVGFALVIELGELM
jgi:hypothetical protein